MPSGGPPAPSRPFALPPAAAGALVAVSTAVVYLLTLCPSLYWGDGPDLVVAAWVAGVPHPTGYPLYTMLGYVWTHLFPAGEVAWKMNLLSALPAAAAAGLFAVAMARLCRSMAVGAASGLILAFGREFWAQAVITEVYGLHMLLTVGALACLFEWDRSGRARWLYAFCFVYGLGFAHHGMSVLLAPALVPFVLTAPRRATVWRRLPACALLWAAPLLLYLYIPLAASQHPPVNWSDVHDWRGLVAHVSGQAYWGLMLHEGGSFLSERWLDYAGWPSGEVRGYLLSQYSPFLLLFAPVGLVSLVRTRKRILLLTVVFWLVGLYYALSYRIFEVSVFFLPSHLAVAFWIGFGLRWARTRLRMLARGRRAGVPRPAIAAILLALPLAPLAWNWSANDRSGFADSIALGRAELTVPDDGAVVLAGGDRHWFPASYALTVENRRPDLHVIDFHDVFIPGRDTAIPRLRAAGLAVDPPGCGHTAAPGEYAFHGCLFEQVLARNSATRSIWLLGAEEAVDAAWLEQALAGYRVVRPTNLPVVRVLPGPPDGDRFPDDAGPPRADSTTFGVRTEGGAVRPVVSFLGHEAISGERGGLPVIRMRYRWRVHDPGLAGRCRVQALFADDRGHYETLPDGSAEFHNHHDFGAGLPAGGSAEGDLVRQFDVFVPPSRVGRPLWLWVGLAVEGRMLAVAGSDALFVRAGRLPVASRPPDRAE